MSKLKLWFTFFLLIQPCYVLQSMEGQIEMEIDLPSRGEELLGSGKSDSDQQHGDSKSKKRKKVETEEVDFAEEDVIKSIKFDEVGLKLQELSKNIQDFDLEKKKKLLEFFQDAVGVVEFEINRHSIEHSSLLVRADEILIYIFEIAIAMPDAWNQMNTYKVIKDAYKLLNAITCSCKKFYSYRSVLHKKFKLYVTNILKDLIRQIVYFDAAGSLKLTGNYDDQIILLLKAGADYNCRIVIEDERDGESQDIVHDHTNLNLIGFKELIFMRGLWSCEVAKDLIQLMSSEDLEEQDQDGNTLLMRCLLTKNKELPIPILLNGIFDLNKQNNEGDTALMLCVKFGCSDCQNGDDSYFYFKLIPLLLKKNADPNMLYKYGSSALHYLIETCRRNERGFIEGMKAFFSGYSGKVDPNIQDAEGNTPLMLLMKPGECPGYRNVFYYLLYQGASLDLQNNQKKTVWDLAQDDRKDLLEQCRKSAKAGEPIFCEINEMYVLPSILGYST